MDEEKQRYVEDFAAFWGGFGLQKMQGRVMGALLVADPPERTAEELAEELLASRGSISSVTRSLVQMGLVERGTRIGERRDYFRSNPDWTSLMRQQIGTYKSFREIAERGLEIMRDGSPESRKDLEEMCSLFSYMEREMPRFLDDWERSRREEER